MEALFMKFSGHDPIRIAEATLRVTIGNDRVEMWRAHQRGDSYERLGRTYGVNPKTAHYHVRRVGETLEKIKSSLER